MSAAPDLDEYLKAGASPEMAPGPVGGPGAWRGADMARRPDEWRYRFSAQEVRELDDAMRQSRDKAIIDVSKADFPLPTLGPVFAAMRRELLEGRGFVLLQGVPALDYTIEESARIYWGIGMHFGTARSQNAKGHLLGHVCALGDGYDAFKNPGKARIYQTRDRQLYHTDSTDLVGLMCLQKSKSGGESSICSSVTVHDLMWQTDRELWAELYKPMWRDRRGEVPPGKLGYYPMAAFHYFQGRLSTIYARNYTESAQRFEELPRLTERQYAAMDLFDSFSNDPDIRLDMAFEPGDIQLLHNHQILHARAPFEDWPEKARRRHLLRLWLCPPDGRPLPPSLIERYLSLEIGNRGGIVGPDTVPCVPLEPV